MEEERLWEIEKSVAAWNIVLALVQMGAGMMSGSVIMLADALYSAHHASGTVSEGRSKKEWLVCILLNVIFVLACLFLIIINVWQLMDGSYKNGSRPGFFVIIVCASSVIIKRLLCQNLLYLFTKYKSSSLLGDAWHQKMDGMLFFASLLGLCAGQLGFLWAEPLVGIGICLYFIKRLLVL